MKKLIGALLFFVAVQANADGNELLANCSVFEKREVSEAPLSHSEYFKLGQCLGAVEGVRNTMLLLNSFVIPVMKVCMPPKGIVNGQAIRITQKYLRDNPSTLHEDATVLLMKAFHQAFPCSAVGQ